MSAYLEFNKQIRSLITTLDFLYKMDVLSQKEYDELIEKVCKIQEIVEYEL